MQKGTTHSEETRALMSARRKGTGIGNRHGAANKGRPSTRGMLGKKHSAETRAKMAAAQQAYWAQVKAESQQ